MNKLSTYLKPQEPKPSLLPYERFGGAEPPTLRPWWVYGLAGLYLLVLLTFLTLPAWVNLMFAPDRGELAGLAIFVATWTVCGLSLMLIPVRTIRRRRVTRRSVWIPVIASGLLAGALVVGGAMALSEYLRADGAIGWTVLG